MLDLTILYLNIKGVLYNCDVLIHLRLKES